MEVEKKNLFEGLSFAFNSHTKFRNDDAELANLITENGGSIARNIGKEVTHLISSGNVETLRTKLAVKQGIKIIDEQYIVDCASAEKLLDESKYIINPDSPVTPNDPPINEIKPKTNEKKIEKSESAKIGFKVILVLQYKSDSKFELQSGANILGRGPLLGIDDKQCSRQQAEIVVNEESRTVNLIAHGVNPCFLKKPFQEPLLMEKDTPYELENGDIFTLLVNEYPVKVIIEEKELETVKRKIADDIEEDEVKETKLIKKQKMDTDEKAGSDTEMNDGRPLCPYGLECYRKNPDHRKQFAHIDMGKSSSSKTKQTKKTETSDGKFSLVFPSISTNTYQFDINKAAQVACKVITEFLVAHPNPDIRLILVDTTNSETLQAFRKHYTLGDSRFIITTANITKMKSSSNLACRFIANAANPDFHPQGSGVNKAIHDAAGPSLHTETKKLYNRADVGKAYRVELPKESPLRKNEGVQYVIHVVGPNMNPQRPNCLYGDYKQGCSLLTQCYQNLLTSFYDVVEPDDTQAPVDFSFKPATQFGSFSGSKFDEVMRDLDEDIKKNTSENKSAFSVLMSNASKSGAFNKSSKAEKEDESEGKEEKQKKTGKAIGGWAGALTQYVLHPESFEEVYYHDKNVVVIYDKFPKAKYHFLVMPAYVCPNFSALGPDDIPTLKEMKKRGDMIVNQIKEKHPDAEFRLGFHAIPSMSQVHMHVISQDFNSDSLKKKKHWNSFTTEFFISANDFIKKFESQKSIKFDKTEYEPLLEGPMKCHRCKKVQENIPKLKQHISTCKG